VSADTLCIVTCIGAAPTPHRLRFWLRALDG
jgi:hypothetical protein